MKKRLLNFMRINNKQSEVILCKDEEWALIDGELCLVTNFEPMGGSVVEEKVVISPDTSIPYASIEIECESYKNAKGFITHKIDFSHLWNAFNERGVNKEKEEVLIYWTTKRYKYELDTLGSTIMPKLIVMICPKGTYKYSKVSPVGARLLSSHEILLHLHVLSAIEWWVPDVIK